MLQTNTNTCWTHSSNADGDGKRIVDEIRMPSPCLKSIDMEFVDSRCAASDLTLMGNVLEEKGNNDLLFYSWPELQNFEDVDTMFRSCDSTFGLEMDSWFPSSHAVEGSTDALTSCFDFPSSSPCGPDEQQEVYGHSDNGLSVDEGQKDLTLARCERDSLDFVPDKPRKETESEMQSHVSPLKYHKSSSEGKRKDDSPENGISFIQLDKLSEAAASNPLSNSQNNSSPEGLQQREIKPSTSIPSNQVLSGTSSVAKSEVIVLPTISPKVSSHGSNQNHSVENSYDVSSQKPSQENKKKRKSHEHRSSRPTAKPKLLVERANSDLHNANKPVPGGKIEAEGQSAVDGTDVGFTEKLDSSSKPENSCMSSVLNEASIDSSSLKQLQHVMVQLDRRSRLCIRDSLYRLARSAAQRHHYVNYSSVKEENKDSTGALSSDGTNKSAAFIDIETDTNPIDRSIAHLLFHRPSDATAAATPDLVNTVAVKSNTMVEPPNQSTSDAPACREQTSLVDEGTNKQRNLKIMNV